MVCGGRLRFVSTVGSCVVDDLGAHGDRSAARRPSSSFRVASPVAHGTEQLCVCKAAADNPT